MTVLHTHIAHNMHTSHAAINVHTHTCTQTNIGPVLIAVNPFKNIPRLYTEARVREYKGKKFFELPPHIFALVRMLCFAVSIVLFNNVINVFYINNVINGVLHHWMERNRDSVYIFVGVGARTCSTCMCTSLVCVCV